MEANETTEMSRTERRRLRKEKVMAERRLELLEIRQERAERKQRKEIRKMAKKGDVPVEEAKGPPATEPASADAPWPGQETPEEDDILAPLTRSETEEPRVEDAMEAEVVEGPEGGSPASELSKDERKALKRELRSARKAEKKKKGKTGDPSSEGSGEESSAD